MIVFKRNELTKKCRNISIEEIGLEHYPGSMMDIYSSNIVIFVDGERKKILKNRWGYEGIVGNDIVENGR